MSFFNFPKYKLNIKVPLNSKLEWFNDKVRLIGPQNDIFLFARDLSKIEELQNGDLISFDKLTLKVSDYISSDSEKKNWIELPNHAWGIMAGKFYDVCEKYEENPFDFNSCGYTEKIPLDLGVEITDFPITDSILLEKPHVVLIKSEYNELYLRIEDTELFDYIEDYLIEQKDIEPEFHIPSQVGDLRRYIGFPLI